MTLLSKHASRCGTAYDNMKIPRIKGKRREVRRMLAEPSRRLLEKYRAGSAADPYYPLHRALSDTSGSRS